MKLKKIAFFSLSLLVILISGLSSCGSGPGSGGLEKVNGISFKLNWPDNYTFDPASSQLTYNSSPSMMAAPSYVTGCRVTISGSGMDSITLDVPLSTGQVSGSVTPGERRFDVVVDTQYGVTFTGSTTATLVSGSNATISVNLSVNGVPLIDGISVSNSSPRKRESVSLTVSISDLDITDAHTIEWNGGGGRISGSGPTVAWSADRAGVYYVAVTVDDGHGGVAGGNAVIGVTNTPPSIISVTADKTSAVIGDIVNVSCSALDADGDSLTYTWSDGIGWTATGAVAQYTVTSSLVSALKCVVEDGDLNGWASGSVGITATSGSPTGVSATAGDAQATVSWNAVAGATSYNIYWSTTPGTGVGGTKITGATSPYTHTGLTNGTAYYYVVTAVSAGGESGPSAEVGATPQAPAPGSPTGVSATAGDAQATVSWNAVAGATSYNIYWSTTPGTGVGGTKITGATSPYTHTGLTNGTAYYYVVTAVSAGGESGPSAEAGATPQATAPGSPTGVSAAGEAQQIKVTWSAVAGAVSYNIYWSASPGVTTTTGTKITGATSPYQITGLADATTYYCVVTAVGGGGGESAPSAEVNATTYQPVTVTVPAP